MLFLKIVLGCLLAILILGLLLVGGIALWFRNMMKHGANDCRQTLSIHLHEELHPEWTKNKKVKALIEEFEANGFTQGKAYIIEEMDGVDLLSLFHEKYAAVIYSNELIGVGFDIAHGTPDEQYFTVSNLPTADNLESPPNLEKLRIPENSTVREALALVEERCGNLESVVLNDDNFRMYVEGYYKEEQAYRNRNGGLSYEEFVRSAHSVGDKKYTEKQLREAYIESKVEELELWNEAAVDEFLSKQEKSEDDEDGYQRLFVVPEKTDAESFVHLLSDFDLVDEDHVEKVGKTVKEQTDIYQLFEKLNHARSPERRARPLGTVDFPVAAMVYEVDWRW